MPIVIAGTMRLYELMMDLLFIFLGVHVIALMICR